MNFTEKAFVPFALVVLLLWAICRHREGHRLGVLLAASLFAYGFHQWQLLLLLLTYCVVNWAFALWLARSSRPGRVLAFGVALNLLGLAFWKYVPMAVQTVIDVAFVFNIALDLMAPHWILPWGISFYTFTCIAYLTDVYRGDHPAERSLARFTLFIAFFPHLVAGPILRGKDFLDALQPGALPKQPLAPLEAMTLVARGAFKKLVLADRIALAIDPFFAHVADGSADGVWALPFVWLYALQIFFDFSGYTDMARGFGLLFGFRWPDNFFEPYFAGSVQEFWKRWHVTLSTFLRDYLYVPLGGNRFGPWRTRFNLMVTMLLGGLWHGPSWSFLIWGGLHGLFLVAHRAWAETALSRRCRQAPGFAGAFYHVAAIAVTFHLVCLAWCFFRLTDFHASVICVAKWWPANVAWFAGGSADLSVWSLLAVYAAIAALVKWTPPLDADSPGRKGLAWGSAVAMLLLAVCLSPGGQAPAFIYFQF
jgi:alginate O-acetyltransferase complex protein AlgI